MGRKRKLAIRGIGALVGLALGGVLAVVLLARAQGESLTTYLGQQVVGIANGYLVPQMSFRELEYEAPYSLTMRDVMLVAPDGTDVLDIGVMSIELAERPRRGEPIRIAEIVVSDGVVHVIQDPETGEIRGLVPFVKGQSRDTDDGPDETAEPATRLSDVFELRKLVIENLDLAWDPGDGTPVMRVPGFAMNLDVVPRDNDAPDGRAGMAEAANAASSGDGPGTTPDKETPDRAGWYDLSFESGRAPGLRLDIEGSFNIDTFEAEVDRGFAELLVGEDTIGSLPGRVQQLLGELEASGDLMVEFAGRAPLRDAMAGGRLDLLVTLKGFNIVPGDLRVPINELVIEGALDGGVARVAQLTADTLSGSVRADARIELTSEGMPAEAWWELSGLDLEQLLAHQNPDEPPAIAGLLTGTGTATARATDALGTISGEGEVHLKQGRLVKLPVLTQLANAADAVGFGQSASKNHSLDAEFTLEPAGVRLSGFEVVTTTLAARGKGLIRWDGTLNLEANAGPLEKLQNMLGGVGKLLGQLTDSVMTYLITGPATDPEIGVSTLGIGESAESKQERRGDGQGSGEEPGSDGSQDGGQDGGADG
ncbi:MAG: hypothetical protein ACF8Q5_07330 [Phycisphaerales bacterium JB040]